MLDLNLTASIAVSFDSMIAGITPIQSQPRVDAMRWWSMHGMHDRSGCPAVRLLLFRSAARALCRYCGVGSYALLQKCVPKLLASLDCVHLRTPCLTSIPADTRSSMSRSGLAGQALHCACRTACIQMWAVLLPSKLRSFTPRFSGQLNFQCCNQAIIARSMLYNCLATCYCKAPILQGYTEVCNNIEETTGFWYLGRQAPYGMKMSLPHSGNRQQCTDMPLHLSAKPVLPNTMLKLPASMSHLQHCHSGTWLANWVP